MPIGSSATPGRAERGCAPSSRTTSRSANQAATVSVNAAGGLQSVRLNDRITKLSPAQVAASIMEAYRSATAQVSARTAEIAGPERSTYTCSRASCTMRATTPSTTASGPRLRWAARAR